MKHFFLFLLILQFSVSVWTLEIGTDMEQTIIFHEKTRYSPASSSSFETSLFARHSFYGKWIYLDFAPMIKIHTDTPRFGFYELGVSLFINNISLSLGKNNFYFGDGISQNIFFPVTLISNDQISKQKFWNMRLNAVIHAFSLSMGYIVDTVSMDNYKAPEWHSVYGVVDYSRESYGLSLESDVRFTANGDVSGKTALASKLLFDDTFSLYNTIAYKFAEEMSFKHSFSVITGISKYYLLHPLAFTSIIESFYAESIINMSFYQNIEYKDLVLTVGICASRDLLAGTNMIKPQTTLDLYISDLNFEISYTYGNLLSENLFADSILFLRIKYVLN
jgi:hypothetical protein